MKYGVIDIGSNTIRGVIYEVKGKSFESVFNEAEYAALLGYVRGGILTANGYNCLVYSLKHLLDMMRPYECEKISAFATASLRDIKDKDALFRKINKSLGLDIRFISGEDEALYDYRAIKRAMPRSRGGVGVDLGGGSCQLFRYGDGEIIQTGCLPIGSLKMYERFVDEMLPIESELNEIRRYAESELESLPLLKDCGYETIYAMGGTARALSELLRILSGNRRVDHRIISTDDMEDILEMSSANLARTARMIHQLMAKRFTTIIPGTAVLLEVCNYTGASRIKVLPCGVREGFMATMVEDN